MAHINEDSHALLHPSQPVGNLNTRINFTCVAVQIFWTRLTIEFVLPQIVVASSDEPDTRHEPFGNVSD
jgi:hypothetical protein